MYDPIEIKCTEAERTTLIDSLSQSAFCPSLSLRYGCIHTSVTKRECEACIAKNIKFTITDQKEMKVLKIECTEEEMNRILNSDDCPVAFMGFIPRCTRFNNYCEACIKSSVEFVVIDMPQQSELQCSRKELVGGDTT